MKFKISSISFIVIFLLSACAGLTSETPEEKALKEAVRIISKMSPDDRGELAPPFLIDRGSYWEIGFRPSGDTITGGGITLYLEKNTYKVIKAMLGQ
jgi:hypothetical protein